MLRAPLPDSKPRVLCNFLTTEDDRRTLIEGMRIALEIATQPALQAVERRAVQRSGLGLGRGHPRLGAASPASPSTTRPRRARWARSSIPELRVYGIDGLRVADASVMPTITRANTNAATIMIAEKAADLIRSRTPDQAATAERSIMSATTEAVVETQVEDLLDESAWTGKIFSDGWVDAPAQIETVEPATGDVLGTAGGGDAETIAARGDGRGGGATRLGGRRRSSTASP